MKKRDTTLNDYNISKNKYMELKYFCMQYSEKVQILSGSEGRRQKRLQEDIRLIEQTAIMADSRVYQHIIQNVTEGIPYEYLCGVPLSRSRFYDSRRYFFYLLAQER